MITSYDRTPSQHFKPHRWLDFYSMDRDFGDSQDVDVVHVLFQVYHVIMKSLEFHHATFCEVAGILRPHDFILDHVRCRISIEVPT